MTDPQVIVNLGTGGSDLNGQNGSTSSADSNDARFLDWPGDNAGNYVYLPGAQGNVLTVPDSASLTVTDLDIAVRVALDDYSPTSNSYLAAKFASGSESWRILIFTTGTLRLYWTEDGSTNLNSTSTTTPTATDGEPLWLRFTMDASSGDVAFYQAADSSDVPTVWTQIGSTVSGSGATSVYDGTADVCLGARSVTTSDAIAGKFYRLVQRDTIDGTLVLDVDTSVISSGSATSFTAVTGQTVTINRSTSGRKSVAVVSPVWLFGTDDFIRVAHNDLLSTFDGDAFTFLAIARVWDDTLSSVGLASKKAGSTTSDPGWVVQRDGTNDEFRVVIDDSDGDRTFGDSPAYVEGGVSVYAVGFDTATGTRRIYLDGVASDSTWANIGDLSNTSDLEIGRRFGGSYWNFELVGTAFYSRLLSVTELDAIRAYYQARLS